MNGKELKHETQNMSFSERVLPQGMERTATSTAILVVVNTSIPSISSIDTSTAILVVVNTSIPSISSIDKNWP